MNSKNKLVLAAISGLTLGLTMPSTSYAQDPGKPATDVKCYGINSCKANAGCLVHASDLNAVKKLVGAKEYALKYGKSKAHSCGAHASCGASHEILNWTSVSENECKAGGGYVIEESNGKKVAKKL